MKEITLTTIIKECAFEELSKEERQLVEKAKEMARSSYAPYSQFHVGAAIELADGTVVCGSNQENAAYPSGTCAERTACYQAGALYPGKGFRRIAIAARTEDNGRNKTGDSDKGNFQRMPISPCGACRQALLEYERLSGGPVEVILYGSEKCYIFPSVASLLPFCFTEF